MSKNKISILLGVVCMMLSIAIAVQINTIRGTGSTMSSNFTEDSLRDEVLEWKEKYDNATTELDEAEKELATIRENATQNDDTATAKEKQIILNNNLLGLTTLEGKGIELVVEDDPTVTSETIGIYDDISIHIVHDGDLRRIVNELKNAGAEAISINGQRIVTTTAITCIGNVIKINDEKVSSPFIIKAIGFPESMESALNRLGGYIDYLNDDGIVTTIKKLDNIKITKFTGVITSKYMK